MADIAQAESLEDQAKQAFSDGANEDERGDKFELAAVLFALTLFFGGIATLFAKRKVTSALLAMATVTLVVGAVQLVAAY